MIVDRGLCLLFGHGRLSNPTCGVLHSHVDVDVDVAVDLVHVKIHVIVVHWSFFIVMLVILLLFDKLGINTIRVIPLQRVVATHLCQLALF